MLEGNSVFLTGAPGAGKTYTIREFIKRSFNHGKIHDYRGDAARLESKQERSHAQRKLRVAALGMLGVSGLSVGVETALDFSDEPAAHINVLAGVDIAANALGLAYLVAEKNNKTHALKASVLHAFVDTGGMVATVIGVFGKNPAYGVMGHAAAIAFIAGVELYSSRSGSTATAAIPFADPPETENH